VTACRSQPPAGLLGTVDMPTISPIADSAASHRDASPSSFPLRTLI